MGKLILEEQAAAGTPAANKIAIYPKAGGGIYKKDDAGVEVQLDLGDVTAAANIDANAIVVGDDGAKGVKKLALGAANLKLFMNAAGTANEYASGMKIGTFTRDTAIASGNQAISGVGFKPSHVIFLGAIANTNEVTIGFGDGTNNYCVNRIGTWWSRHTDSSLFLYQGSGVNYSGVVSVLGADGFTVTWTKTGAKTGSVVISYMAFR